MEKTAQAPAPQPEQEQHDSGYVVTPLNKLATHNHWKVVILACAFLMLLMSLCAGAFVLATRQTASKRTTPTPSAPKLSGDYAPPATVVHPPEDETQNWKTFNAVFFSLKYPPDWISEKDPSVQNGVKIFNPGTMVQDTASKSGVTTSSPTQYLLISYHTASESALQYVEKIQLNCCIGPSAIPGAESLFKKQSLTVNGFEAYAYNPVTDVMKGWNYVFSDKTRIVEIFTSAPTPTGNSIEDRIISTFMFLP